MLVLKFSENLRVLESVPEKSFHRNDAGFLNLLYHIQQEALKDIAVVYSNLFYCLRNLEILSLKTPFNGWSCWLLTCCTYFRLLNEFYILYYCWNSD